MQTILNINNMLQMQPKDLFGFLYTEYIKDLPEVDDLNGLAYKLSETANIYAFLSGLEAAAKIDVRIAKASGDKEAYGNAIDRRDVIANIMDAIKMQYAAASRMITVKEKIEEEMRMAGKTE